MARSPDCQVAWPAAPTTSFLLSHPSAFVLPRYLSLCNSPSSSCCHCSYRWLRLARAGYIMDETEMKKSKQYHGIWTACMPDVGFRFFRKCQYEFEIKPGAFISPHSKAIENESTSFVAAGWSWKGRSKDTKKEISGGFDCSGGC